MRHLKSVSKAPRRAQDLSTGNILVVIGQLLAVVAGFFTEKESAAE
jgi:hypothetical protein